MSRPDDIPEALWESREVLGIACKPVGARELVCRAILAAEQRVMEECAQIAREHDMASGESIAHMIMTRHEWQAAAIRKGGEHA